ncbi:MAG: DUF3025 domain-containing protein [Oxalobacteraceae bacterium]
MDFSVIDWQRPWLAHLRDVGTQLTASPDWIAAATAFACERGLTNSRHLPIVFAPPDSRPTSVGYEAHIHATGHVPTRDNLHDFFNALVWLHFPATKRMLNQQQADEIHRHPRQHYRGKQRDAATLFDENAAIFVSHDPSMTAWLAQRQWRILLLANAARFHAECQVILFGHALLEKLIQPYKAITAHVWSMHANDGHIQSHDALPLPLLDERLAKTLAPGFVSHDFHHLPILGVPGWWQGQDEAFYADDSVFRPPVLP